MSDTNDISVTKNNLTSNSMPAKTVDFMPKESWQRYIIAGALTLLTVLVSVVVIVLLIKIRRLKRQIDPVKYKNRKEIKIDKRQLILPDDRNYELEKSKLTFDMKIGSGTYGSLYVGSALLPAGSRREVKKHVAIRKCIGTPSQERLTLIAIVKTLIHVRNHENIMCLLGMVTKDPTTKDLIVLEYCEHGNLENFFKSKKSIFVDELDTEIDKIVKRPPRPERTDLTTSVNQFHKYEFSTCDLLCWSRQIANGMDYLGTRKIVHRALTTRSVYLCENNIVKIGDFDFAQFVENLDGQTFPTEPKLPIKTFSPEVYFDSMFSCATDVWAFGVLMWEMFSLGQQPYKKTDSTLGTFLKSGHFLDKPKTSSTRVYELMTECWYRLKESRPRFTDIVRDLKTVEDNAVLKNYASLDLDHFPTRRVVIAYANLEV